jgi:hypothetical protein
MSISQNYPLTSPSLNLDFANTKALDPRITFSRPTTAVYYDGQTVTKAEENLLLRSQEFDNAYWPKDVGITITANATTAPDGTTTAELFDEGTGTSTKSAIPVVSFLASTTYTLSCFFEDVDRQYVSLAAAGASSAAVSVEFDLTAGTVNRTAANNWTLESSSITSVVSGWYRAVIVFTTNATVSVPRVVIQPSDGTSTLNVASNYGRVQYTGTNKQFHLWGAQLEARDTVTAYTPTTTQAITNYIPTLLTAPTNTARFDHNPVTGESLGLLVEEQRTNVLTYSEDFADAVWTKTNSTVTSNVIVAPDGTLTADKLINDDGLTSGRVTQAYTFSATTYTFSVFAKAAEVSLLRLYYSTTSLANFELSTETITLSGGLSANIENIGNGMYRCSVVFTASAGASNVRIYNRTSAETGDGYSGIYIWGAQLEAGAFPTSYIKTEASQVTRSADSASMVGANFSDWYRADEGSFYCDFTKFAPASIEGVFSIDDGTQNNRFDYRAGQGLVTSSTNNTAYAVLNVGAVGANTPTKTVGSYKVNDFAASKNSGIVQTDNSGVLPTTITTFNIGSLSGSLNKLNGTIKRISYYPQRLTNTNLQALTS